MFRHYRLAWLLLVTLTLSPALVAQQPTAPAPPSPAAGAAPPAGRGGGRGTPPVKSPEIASDGRVTFRLRAPNAKDATVAIGSIRVPMQKDEQGVWSATSDALTPDYYAYSFVVDGTSMNDPANRQLQTSYGSAQSMFVIPGSQPWLPSAGVPRGAITRHPFHSTIANDDREFFVYTPPAYDARRSRPYPVIYLLHGLGDDAERWMNFGGANVIMDNLIAQGKAVPSIVVTPLGYGVNNGPAGAMAPENITGYTKILLTEVMPTVDRSYNVSRSREERAIAGLSMGGAETLYTALNNVDKFAWIGSFSGAFVMWPGAAGSPDGGAGRGRGGPRTVDPAVFDKTFPGFDAKANSQIRMLWITVGTADSLLSVNRQFKNWLKQKNVRFTEEEAPDVGHVWPFWRKNFAEFAQQVFQARTR
jgi:enterochelin esterase family protein